MSKIGEPVMSEGIRSAVNWIRPNWQPKHPAQRPHEQRLAQPRHALDQHVPAGEQGHQRAQHQFVLADEDSAHLFQNTVEQWMPRPIFLDRLFGNRFDAVKFLDNTGFRDVTVITGISSRLRPSLIVRRECVFVFGHIIICLYTRFD